MTRRLAFLALLLAGGCNLDLGAGAPRGTTDSIGTVSIVEGADGGFLVPPDPSSVPTASSCFVPCNGGYGTNCGWVCGGQPSF